ncbi:MAG: hypothetical protein JRI98_10690 [Deltaproteobacteria bacterium]|nr:hypothetical protein [Deltaproteobacteria bacterium]
MKQENFDILVNRGGRAALPSRWGRKLIDPSTSMTRIAYFVHGRGKGHAIRTQAVMGGLRRSHDVRVFCAGEAWDVLKDVPGAEPALPCLPGKGMLRAFALRFRGDRERLQRWSPDLVVSDGDGPSVNAAKSLGIPVMAVGHGLILHHTHLNSALPFRQHARELVNVASSSWPATRRVAVHFAPVRPRTPGTYVARPDLRSGIQRASRREDFLLAYFRDGNGLAPLERLVRRGHRVVLFGEPRKVPRGVEVHPSNVQAFAEALGRCRAVVGSAGNHLPAECAMLGIPRAHPTLRSRARQAPRPARRPHPGNAPRFRGHPSRNRPALPASVRACSMEDADRLTSSRPRASSPGQRTGKAWL